MKFTFHWLKEHLQTSWSQKQITDRLTHIGLELEKIHSPYGYLKQIHVAQVLSVQPHPDAQRLNLCQVDTGDKVIEVVCGAPNVREGLKVPLALPGALIPSTQQVLKKGKIRGVVSHGMLCSAQELNWGQDHDGIMELPQDACVGQSMDQVLGHDDAVIEINLTPDRADCASVRGIARDLAAAGAGDLKPLHQAEPLKTTFESPINVVISQQVMDQKHCLSFLGCLIKGVKNVESPPWMQERLSAIGVKKINGLVDVTNWMLMDTGRAFHAFDADAISGNLTVRYARDGEVFHGLNDQVYHLDASDLVVADDNGVQALAGVLGGQSSACHEGTKNVFLECAVFDPICVAQTGRRHHIVTDSRYRFERGMDHRLGPWALSRAANLMVDICAGQISSPVGGDYDEPERQVLSFDPNHVVRLTGVSLSSSHIAKTLRCLGFHVKDQHTPWQIEVPSWRHDVKVSADIVADVVRLWGFEHIPTEFLPGQKEIPDAALDEKDQHISQLRRFMASRGFDEALTWSFADHGVAERFAPLKPEMFLANPISQNLDVLRPHILIHLLQALGRNQNRDLTHVNLFELGPVFSGGNVGDQQLCLGALRWGQAHERHWLADHRLVDVYDIKADIYDALEKMGLAVKRCQLQQGQAGDVYHPGQNATVVLGKKKLACFGQVHPALLKALSIKGPVVAGEIFVDDLPLQKKKKQRPKAFHVSDFQSVKRDFAFVIKENVAVGDMVTLIEKLDANLVREVSIFDIYRAQELGDGHLSVALCVILQSHHKTLTDEDIEAFCHDVVALMCEKFQARLREVA